MLRFFWITLYFLSSLLTAKAADFKGGGITVCKSDTLAVYFRFDRFDVDETYLDNKTQLESIRRIVSGNTQIDSIIIYSWASPEGAFGRNAYLADKRSLAIRDYLLNECGDSSSISADKIKMNSQDENWPGLLAVVDSLYFRNDRERVISILKNNKISNETRKWRLKQLDGGYTWDFIRRRYMPLLRSATWICLWTSEKSINPAEPRELTVASLPPIDTLVFQPEQKPIPPRKYTIFALRSNLLVPLLNVGVEVPIGNRWSVGADYYYPWAKRKSDNMKCFQLLGVNLEGRYWFGSRRTIYDRLKGHSIGVMLGGGYYDFEKDYEGDQGEYVVIGADYLYAMPIFKGKLHLEFSVGVGYAFSGMRPYDVFEPGGKAFKEGYTKKNHWVGPTKAAISLVVPIKRKIGR